MSLHIKTDAEALAELRKIFEDARKAMNDGRLGDLRRILNTGRADALKSTTGVIARDGGAA